MNRIAGRVFSTWSSKGRRDVVLWGIGCCRYVGFRALYHQPELEVTRIPRHEVPIAYSCGYQPAGKCPHTTQAVKRRQQMPGLAVAVSRLVMAVFSFCGLMPAAICCRRSATEPQACTSGLLSKYCLTKGFQPWERRAPARLHSPQLPSWSSAFPDAPTYCHLKSHGSQGVSPRRLAPPKDEAFSYSNGGTSLRVRV